MKRSCLTKLIITVPARSVCNRSLPVPFDVSKSTTPQIDSSWISNTRAWVLLAAVVHPRRSIPHGMHSPTRSALGRCLEATLGRNSVMDKRQPTTELLSPCISICPCGNTPERVNLFEWMPWNPTGGKQARSGPCKSPLKSRIRSVIQELTNPHKHST